MALQAGHLFGNYRIVRLLGEGGFGEVYLAENPLIQRRAAVKVLHKSLAEDSVSVRRFLNEARAASAIRHGNIIEVFDAGVTPDGAPYILMEFLEGVSLHKRLAEKGRLTLPQTLEIARQAGSALAAAHTAGIVHRDLKPENLFLVPDPGAPGGERVKILDFGIAKIRHSSDTDGTSRTQSGLIMGSPSYMSPEQCRDSADVDLRADVYSFAILIYKMLAGRTPYVGASGTEMLLKHLSETPPLLREWVPDVPAHVEAAVMRGLARARTDRFDSMASFVGALLGNVDGDALGRPSPTPAFPPVGGNHDANTEATRTATKILPAAGEARAASGGDTLAVATRILADADDGHAPRAEATSAGQASTTFSRVTGELGVPARPETSLPIARVRRWPIFAFACVALAGLALLVRSSYAPRSSVLRIAGVDAAVVSSAAISGRDLPGSNAGAPLVFAGRSDAGVAAPGVHLPPDSQGNRRPENVRAGRTTPRRAGPRNSVAPSTLKNQEDVAGF